jgi:eukaryotic-like serine/threonine-protein kinase
VISGELLLRANNFKDSAANIIATSALLEAAVGDFATARRQATASVALSRTRSNLPLLADALALSGDSAQVLSFVQDLKRRYPSDFQVNNITVPIAAALLDSGRGNASAALQSLDRAKRDELGCAWTFVPIYVRGLVYLRNRQGKEAAAEFQRILRYSALGTSNSFYPLAYVGLARASALSGDTAKARTAYQDFLALWKDADRDVPILNQAKSEYASFH